MLAWAQRILQKVVKTFRHVFIPVLISTDGGNVVVLTETVWQRVVRKVTAVVLGSIAIVIMADPDAFGLERKLAERFGDWLSTTANALWMFNGFEDMHLNP